MIDFSAVSVIDSTAAATIEGFARKARRHHAQIYIAGALPAVRRALLTHGVRRPGVSFAANVVEARSAARAAIESITHPRCCGTGSPAMKIQRLRRSRTTTSMRAIS